MKKFYLLLVVAVAVLSAAAGVNNRMVINNKMTKSDFSEIKANALSRHNVVKRGSAEAVSTTQLNVFDKSIRHANHALRAEGQIVWDFEDEAQLNDWSVIDNDGDGYNWELLSGEGIKVHSGTYCMSSESYNNATYSALNPDNWLVSPVVTLNGTLGFYACGQDAGWAGEVFAVYVCVGEPNGAESFVKISDDITATGSMKAYAFDLSEYEGQEGCIAIRHYNVTDMYRLNVDDITIGEFDPDPEPETPTVITDIPEGYETITFFRNSGVIFEGLGGLSAAATDGKFTLAFGADEVVYLQNPLWYFGTENIWVKGTLDWNTGIISIPVNQYLYYDEEAAFGIQLTWGSTQVYPGEVDEQTGETTYYMDAMIDDRATEIQFMLGEDDTIYLLNSEGNINAEFPERGNATGMMAVYSDNQAFMTIEFTNIDETGEAAPFGYIVYAVPAVPANPTADEWLDHGDESGLSQFFFTLPTTDVDGNLLDPECVSFSIFVDNGNGPEIFTFTTDEYTYGDLTEDLTEVPYELYTYGIDFYKSYVYFYHTNAEGYEPLFTQNIGIQAYYTVDGEKNASDIAWLYEVAPSSVDELNANKQVANVRFYNIAGQEVSQPSGVTIMVTTFTDGTSKTTKVVK